MKRLIISPCLFILLSLLSLIGFNCSNNKQTDIISFYEVPLICGAAPEIGCGSRIKPLFIDTEKEMAIKESWSNRQGTVIAIIWNDLSQNDSIRESMIQSLFLKNDIEATLITRDSVINNLTLSLHGKDKWYKGMDVEQLSIEEAGIIAEDLTKFVLDSGLMNISETKAVKKDLEDYFKKELLKVRTYDDLKGPVTQKRWQDDGYQIYISHIGKERTDKVVALYLKKLSREKGCKEEKDSICDKTGEK
jgi:hypothetical protein